MKLLSAAIAVGLLSLSGSAFAITNVESNASIPFSFSNPGARSLAMGGAFLGAADDATAALTNPAGLTRLGLEQQFSLEFRRYALETPYVAGGTANAGPFDPTGIDYDNDSDNQDDLSFVSWVLPRDNWAIALYRHSTVNFEGSYSTDPVFFTGALDGFFVRPYDVATDLEIVNYGASFAMNLSDNLSFGVGASYYDFELASLTQRYDEDRAALANSQVQSGDDSDIAYNVGLLFRATDGVSIGLTYRSAAEFSYDMASDFFPDDGSDPIRTAQSRTPFKMPDVLGVGISWRASDSLTFNLDVNRVGYSNLTDRVDDPFFSGGEFEDLIDPQILRSIEIDDAIEPRFGVEYLITDTAYPVALRAGTWHEERHTLEFTGDPDGLNFNEPLTAAANAVLFSAGDDETHYSVGFGVVFPNFQLDFAYDHSDTLDTLSFSGVYRF